MHDIKQFLLVSETHPWVSQLNMQMYNVLLSTILIRYRFAGISVWNEHSPKIDSSLSEKVSRKKYFFYYAM